MNVCFFFFAFPAGASMAWISQQVTRWERRVFQRCCSLRGQLVSHGKRFLEELRARRSADVYRVSGQVAIGLLSSVTCPDGEKGVLDNQYLRNLCQPKLFLCQPWSCMDRRLPKSLKKTHVKTVSSKPLQPDRTFSSSLTCAGDNATVRSSPHACIAPAVLENHSQFHEVKEAENTDNTSTEENGYFYMAFHVESSIKNKRQAARSFTMSNKSVRSLPAKSKSRKPMQKLAAAHFFLDYSPG